MDDARVEGCDMNNDNNPGYKDSGSRSLLQFPAILESVRHRSVQSLADLMHALLEGLDTALYDSVKDAPEAEQARVSAIIHECKQRKASIETHFRDQIDAGYRGLLSSRDKSEGLSLEFSADSLSLVDDSDMDLTVVTQTMVSRSRLTNAAGLGQLTVRFAHLLPKVDVSQRTLPLDPQMVVDAFRDALKPLPLQLEDRVQLFEVFNKKVLSDLALVLDEANQALLDAGVLPEAGKPRPRISQSPAGAGRDGKGGNNADVPSADSASATAPASVTEESFSAMRELLSVVRAGGMAGGVGGLMGGGFSSGAGFSVLSGGVIGSSVAAVPLAPLHIPEGAVVQTVDTRQLMDMLSDIQLRLPKGALLEDDSSPTPGEVRESIRESLVQTDKEVQTVRQADEDVINLVSMLFDFILDDDDLPMPMKALLGRLQIPLLKVAIIDKGFFSAEAHPARQLLNALAKAGVGWSDKNPGGDVLYAKIEHVVFRILNEFMDDLALFSDLLAEFTEFVEINDKRQELVEKRTCEAEEGRARADLARAMVQQTLNRRLSGRQVPLVVIKLLQEAWKNVLYMHCLKGGTESEEWKQAVKVVDALVWSVIPQPNIEWKKKLAEVVPKLVNSLKKGLAAVHYDPLLLDALLWDLNEVHEGLLLGEEARTVSVLTQDQAPTTAEGEIETSEALVVATEMSAVDEQKVAAVVLPAPPELVQEVKKEDQLPEDDAVLEQVAALGAGSWVEFVDGDKVERHKLVARIRSIDKLIFANRRGIKVAEMSGMQLAIDIRAGKARLIEVEDHVFDRALESVIGALRHAREAVA